MEPSEIVLPKDYPREGTASAPHAYYVYFIYCAGRVKIGRAVDVKQRLSSISTGSPFRPTMLLAVSASLSGEREIHARFAEDRVHREWFRLSDYLRRYIVRRLDAEGLAAFRKAEDDFLESFLPGVAEGRRAWKKPPKLCSHRVPMSKPCAKCTKEADMRVYAELLRRMG